MRPKGFPIRFVVALGLSALCAALAVRNVDFSRISEVFGRFDPAPFALGVLAYASIPIWRAFRWKLLLAPIRSIGAAPLFGYLCVGTLVNLVVPARAGELYRTWLVARDHRFSTATSLGVAALERLFDLSILLVAILLALAFLESSSTWVLDLSLLPLAGLGVMVLLLFGVALFPHNARKLLEFFVAHLPASWRRVVGETLENLLAGLATIRNPVIFLKALYLTTLQRALKFAFFLLALLAFGLDIGPFETLFTMCAVAFSSMIPAVPTSVGVHHYAVVASLSLFGVSSTEGISAAVAIHLAEVITDVALGVGSMLIMQLPFRLDPASVPATKDEP